MHSLQPNWTIPHSLNPTPLRRRRSRALPSLALRPELVLDIRRPGELLGEEVGIAEDGARGAEESTWRHLALGLSLFFDQDSRLTGEGVSIDGS